MVFFVVLKNPMKLVTGGIKVKESLRWILGLNFLRCSFPFLKIGIMDGPPFFSRLKGKHFYHKN